MAQPKTGLSRRRTLILSLGSNCDSTRSPAAGIWRSISWQCCPDLCYLNGNRNARLRGRACISSGRIGRAIGPTPVGLCAEVRAVHRHARRLAKDLALFDSVWVDALVQARSLRHSKPARVNAGQSDSLRVGPFVLLSRLPSPGYATCYRAREVDGAHDVRLTVIDSRGDSGEILAQLQRVIERTAAIGTPHFLPIERCGGDDRQVWSVSRHVTGRTATEWLIRGGRLPPDLVLEIARQMAAALTLCEARGVVHGDISATQLVLDPLGAVQLLDPGLRRAVRPREDEQAPELLPADYDYLAPERLGEAATASAAADIYACGALMVAFVGWPAAAGGRNERRSPSRRTLDAHSQHLPDCA